MSVDDDDDLVVASYDVFITNPPNSGAALSSKLMVLQYPSHRPLSKPYNAARSQKPTSLRLKPESGVIEVEVPILTEENYNSHAGEKFGRSLTESQVEKRGGSYGLAGGFSYAPAPVQSLSDIPAHDEQTRLNLHTQTIGGKLVTPSQRDPVYMLGAFHNAELHLTQMDAVIQMRPQLHHIDAEDELEKRKAHTASGGKLKLGFEAPTKLETKAIELKLKNNNEETKDRNLNTNAIILRKIQAEQWSSHEWVDQDDELAAVKYDNSLILKSDPGSKLLRSMISNDDWLEKMSAPREDGKKGLRSKLKGRDRERARRKKVEHEKRRLNAALNNTPGVPVLDSDSDLTDLTDQSDVEMADGGATVNQVDIKQEPAIAPAKISGVPDAEPISTSPTRKRGRPKKSGVVKADD